MNRALKRILISGAALACISFVVILLNQTLQLAEIADRLHPVAGEVVFWGLIFTYALCLAIPSYLLFRLPGPLVPPSEEDSPAFEEHLNRLRARLQKNPRTSEADLTHRDGIETALKLLDQEAQESIRAAGSRAFLVTAVSQSGALDGLVILGVQSKLVWEVAHIYSQRPTLRDMVYLYSNVLGTAFLATELDEAELSEAIQPVLSSVLGSAASAVPGLQVASHVFVNSVMTGTANAFLTLRVGLITQEYCRALVKPHRRSLRRTAVVQAAGMLGGIATDGAKKVSHSIAKASGRKITSAISGVGDSLKSVGGAVARKLSFGEDDEPLGDGESGSDPGDHSGGP